MKTKSVTFILMVLTSFSMYLHLLGNSRSVGRLIGLDQWPDLLEQFKAMVDALVSF